MRAFIAAMVLIIVIGLLLVLPAATVFGATRSGDQIKPDDEPSINITFDGCIVEHEKRPGKKKPRLVITCTKASSVRIN